MSKPVGTVPTFCDCSRCGRLCMGLKRVKRTAGSELNKNISVDGATVSSWEPSRDFSCYHRRPVCSVCVPAKVQSAA